MITVLQNLHGQLIRKSQFCARCLSCLTAQGKSETLKQPQRLNTLPFNQQTSLLSTYLTPTIFNDRNASKRVGLVSLIQSSNQSSLLVKSLNAFPRVSQVPTRTLMDYEEFMENRKNRADNIIKRFRRLGNGLWLRKQQGSRHRVWLKIFKHHGPKKVYKMRRTIICNGKQSRKMDSLVPSKWKKQKWYVDDPYKGYTEETLFHYHPKDLPWNKQKMYTSELNNNYGWRRTQRGNLNRIARKNAHRHPSGSHRQKAFSITQPSGLYH